MKYLKEGILGACIAGGIILILLGIEAVSMGNSFYPAYLITGAILLAGFIMIAQKVLK